MNDTNDQPATLPAKAEEVQAAPQGSASIQTTPGFHTKDAWELAQRQARALTTSTMVPEQYRGEKNLGNCIIALDMAYRMGAAPLMVMQNLYIVQGRPGWSSQFLIATFNKSGRYTGIKYQFNAERTACRAWTTEKSSGERMDGTEINMAMAASEGWLNKPGSKWKTMPEQMLQYRAAAFLIRTIAPEISMGLHTAEEVEDIATVIVEPAPRSFRFSDIEFPRVKAGLENNDYTIQDVLDKHPNLVEEQLNELRGITKPIALATAATE